MGSTVLRMLGGSPDFRLTGAATEPGHPGIGEDAGIRAGTGPAGVLLSDDAAAAVAGCDVAVDFTLPVAATANIAACVAQGCALVLGTTGLDEGHLDQLHRAAGSIGVVYARNMSIGINVLTELARRAVRFMGPGVDIEIAESHHRNKIDAPSGTALQLGEAVAGELGQPLDELAVFDRHAVPGARKKGSIGFSSIRAGAVVGDHSILLATDEEILELKHHALDRGTFARGALRAARWLDGREPGMYSLGDVLGF